MKALALTFLLLPLAALPAEDGPAIDVFAGWSWYPYAYGYPYTVCRPPFPDEHAACGACRTGPCAGSPWCAPYGYAPYGCLGWGYEYGVRIKLKPGNPALFPDAARPQPPPPPGSAPDSLRDRANEQAWNNDIRAFLASLPKPSDRLAATNAPEARPAAP